MPAFTITGTDRKLGAIGIMEPFRTHVIAEDAEQARGLVYRLRSRERQDVHIAAVYESVSAADIQTFTAEAQPGAGGAPVTEDDARKTLDRLKAISAELNAIDTRRCNEPCGPEVDVEERRLELQARTIAAAYGLRLIRQDDPRGVALALATPRSGRFNGFGGAEASWCI